MGNLKNGLVFAYGEDWSCKKCALDKDFSMPVRSYDGRTFQIDLLDPVLGHPVGLYVCEVHLTDTAGNRLESNLMQKYGPAWWRNNPVADANGYVHNIFTFRIPDQSAACGTIQVPAPCCVIDLNTSVRPDFDQEIENGAHGFIYFNGVPYYFDKQGNTLPPEWTFGPLGYRYLIVPCSVKTADATLTISGGGGGSLYDLIVQSCAGLDLSSCYILVTDTDYTTASGFKYDGVANNVGAPIFRTPSIIPFVSDATQHVNTPAQGVPGGLWKIPVDCELKNHSLLLTLLTHETKITVAENCPCYITMNNFQYNNFAAYQVDGGAKQNLGAGMMSFNPSQVPYISNPAKHTYNASTGLWTIPIDCAANDHQLVFFTAAANAVGNVFEVSPLPNCGRPMIDVPVNCFRLEFQIGVDGLCDGFTIFSEPMECPKCDDVLLISGNYKGSADLLGNQYDLNDFDDVDGVPITGGLEAFKNDMLIPAKLRNLPSKLTVTKNENCFGYKSELTEQFKLQGTKAFPPYFAKMVENVFGASQFYINGQAYQLTSDTLFTPISEKGYSAFKLDCVITKCSVGVYFDCSA